MGMLTCAWGEGPSAKAAPIPQGACLFPLFPHPLAVGTTQWSCQRVALCVPEAHLLGIRPDELWLLLWLHRVGGPGSIWMFLVLQPPGAGDPCLAGRPPGGEVLLPAVSEGVQLRERCQVPHSQDPRRGGAGMGAWCERPIRPAARWAGSMEGVGPGRAGRGDGLCDICLSKWPTLRNIAVSLQSGFQLPWKT